MSTPLLRRLAQYQQQQQQPEQQQEPSRTKRPLPPTPPLNGTLRNKPLPQPTQPRTQYSSPSRNPLQDQTQSVVDQTNQCLNDVQIVIPQMVFNDDSEQEEEQDLDKQIPRMVITETNKEEEETELPGITITLDPSSSAVANIPSTKKKPFIPGNEGDQRRISGPRQPPTTSTSGSNERPRIITPLSQSSSRVISESRKLVKSIPQMIVTNNPDSSDTEPTDHIDHPTITVGDRKPILGSQLTCAGCLQLIAGRIVNALNKRWHPDCFRCEHCSIVLEHVAFYEQEGKAYCGVDCDELFSLKCYHCNTSINEDSYVTLDDPSLKGGPRHYHKLHLFCSECGDPFIDPKSLEEQSRISKTSSNNIPSRMPALIGDDPKPFVLYNSYPYCEKCDIRLHRPKCFTCKLPICNDFISALDKLFHDSCFVCFECQNQFSNNQFFLKPLSDLFPDIDPKSKQGIQQVPICLNCYS
ncbi:hypothetical protein MJO28_015807 [Puccinia striiformis f. sp. tritici]|uniref:Uncharacterized protein n=1 Tax=Puccinia striiformis f. sp. tritici TaxID=168172 RepID=A0ACC0DQ44_9BASI|nr:hypothetical protein MJO28_015807 [Puccinia striiformis f. sp. tritici]